MKQPRIYVRPDPDLPKEEAIDRVVCTLLGWFADEAEADGNHELAAGLRAKIARKQTREIDSEC